MRPERGSSSRPDARDGFSAILALSGLHVDLPDHVPRPLDDHFFAFWAESVFSLMPRDVPDIDIFKTCGGGDSPGFVKR